MRQVSWSRLSTFLECNRKGGFKYGLGLTPKHEDNSYGRLVGTGFHAAIASYSVHKDLGLAIRACIDELNGEYKSEKCTWDGSKWVLDSKYFETFAEAVEGATLMCHYHLPRAGFGTDWRVATEREVFGGEYTNTPMTEYEFRVYDLATDTEYHGFIDAILVDLRTNEYVLVDYKTRSNFPSIDVAVVDGQLSMYEYVLSSVLKPIVPINRAIMWQFRVKTPSPASISTRNHLPNTGAATYDTTWEYWCATLPAGIRPEDYRELMQPKLKTDDFYTMPVEVFMNSNSRMFSKKSTVAAIDQMESALYTVQEFGIGSVSAVQSSHKCKDCGFIRLCSGVMRYGGDVDEVVALYYDYKVTEDKGVTDAVD